MTPTYHSTPAPAYISNLEFEYMETYSMQRGMEYEENKKMMGPEYEALKVKKKRNNLTKQEEERLSELQPFFWSPQYLIDKKGNFPPASEKINTFYKGDPRIDQIKNILRTEVNDIPLALCAPVYRDAIIFRNQNHEIVSVLNICLGCQYMQTEMFHHIKGDYYTYYLLKNFFIDVGHDVEQPTYFIWDQILILKEKHAQKLLQEQNGKTV